MIHTIGSAGRKIIIITGTSSSVFNNDTDLGIKMVAKARGLESQQQYTRVAN